MKRQTTPPQYRHNAVVRLCHWINVLAFLTLLFSGFQIFNAHPRLYWGEDSDSSRLVFETRAEQDTEGRWHGLLRLSGVEIDTTGFLGVSADASGNLRPRGFPNWLTTPNGQWLAMGRRWHLFFAWIFVVNGLAYLVHGLYAVTAKERLSKKEPTSAPGTDGADYAREARPQKYNRVQQYAYLIAVLVLCPLLLMSGLAMSPYMDAVVSELPEFFGGRQSARTAHFILATALSLFTIGHVMMTVFKGFFRLFHSMVSGWYYAG